MTYKVSAILSVYNASEHLMGRFHDLLNQDIYHTGQLQIVVINSGSKHKKDAYLIQQFADRSQHIKVIETHREPLYVAWNRGIEAADGEYITNTNADDRCAPWAMRKLMEPLEAGADVSFSSMYCITTPNAKWDGEWDMYLADLVNYPGGRVPWGHAEFSPGRLIEFCHWGPQPMWRKSLHDQIGMFDTSYALAADYEMWCRMVAAGAKVAPVPLYLVLFYFTPDQLSQSDGDHLMYENRRIRLKYGRQLKAMG